MLATEPQRPLSRSGLNNSILRIWNRGLRPEPLLTVAEWADTYRMLSSKSSNAPGKWRTARTPYLREIMECLSPSSPIEEVIVRKGSQLGFTECNLNWFGYIIDRAPGPILNVLPSELTAERNSRQRIDSLINETPCLRQKVKDRRVRDSGNTIELKEFPGGMLIISGAGSAAVLKSMPIRYLNCEEPDSYVRNVQREGSPYMLAKKRTVTFKYRRKIYLNGTPSVKGASLIDEEFQETDQRWYFVPCPFCAHMQTLRFRDPDGTFRVVWPKTPEGDHLPEQAAYQCEACAVLIPEYKKTEMLSNGEWRPTAKGKPRVAGFHINALYSPIGWYSWADAAAEYLKALKNPDLMVTFTTHVEGVPYAEPFEAPDWQKLYDRREAYPIGVVPRGVLFLVAGADVQKDRIEVEVVGYGRGKESWSVAYRVLEGDTSRQEVWNELDGFLATEWPVAESVATMPIRVLCVDAGYATQEVYSWARKHRQANWGPAGAAATMPRTVVPVMGSGRHTAIVIGVSKTDTKNRQRGVKVWTLGDPVIKGELYRWLRLAIPEAGTAYPPGFCHFPMYGETYFQQLTAERRTVRLTKGFPRAVWEKDPGARNEALDVRVYARAAAAIFGLDRITERQWAELERRLDRPSGSAPAPSPGPSATPSPPVPDAHATPPAKPKSHRPRRIPSPFLR